MDQHQPSIIKPPSLRRPLPGSVNNRSTAKSNQSTGSHQRSVATKAHNYLRNGNIRNPNTSSTKRRNYSKVNNDGDGQQNQGTTDDDDDDDDDFYSSLRKTGQQQVPWDTNVKTSKERDEDEFAKLREMAYEARETKNSLLEWKRKIQALEENLRDQEYAMQEVLVENKALEKEVEKLTRSRMVEANVDTNSQKVGLERNKLRRKELHMAKALSAAREENVKLREELAARETQSNLMDTDQYHTSEYRKKVRRKEAQLEKELLAAVSEKEELIAEVASYNTMVQKLEDLNHKLETELETLASELDISRRIVHTKRSIMQKEISDETRERMRSEVVERLNIELTEKLSKEIGLRMKEEKEKELKSLREIDEKKVENVEHQIPVLEDEIDRLRTKIRHAEEHHERAIAEIEAHYAHKMETMVNNFSDDRQREEMGFIKRVDELSTQNERFMERAAREKDEYGTQVREEVKKEMQKEIQFLANRVSELTKESIEFIEQATKEKELHGKKIREQLTEERDELMTLAAKEKETYGETIRKQIIEEKDQEINAIKLQLEETVKDNAALLEVIEKTSVHQELSEERRIELEECNRQLEELASERDSLLQRVDEIEEKLEDLNDKYSKSVEELNSSQSALESSKNEIIKLKKHKRDLNANIKEHKQECEDLSREVQKIKNHFKYSVLIEYEEKVIAMEREISTLKAAIEQSNASKSENDEMISNQSSLIEQYQTRERERNAEVEKITNELQSAISELESKNLRVAELKDVISKKESDGDKMLQVVKDLRRSVSLKEDEITNLRDKQDRLRQLEASSKVYAEKVTWLNKQLVTHKSRLEHCRCDGTPGNTSSNFNKRDHNTSAIGQSKESVEDLQERVGRLNLMLKTAEKNQHREKMNFEASKEQYREDILSCNDEIERLQSDVLRLKSLLDQSQNDLRAALEKGGGDAKIADEIHRLQAENNLSSEKFTRTLARTNHDHTRFVEEMEGLMRELSMERDDLLRRLVAVEKEAYDATKIYMHEKSELKETIQDLKDDLNVCNEEKNGIVKELQKSKLLFKEAVVSWRGETRELQRELDHLKQSKRSDTESSNNTKYSENSTVDDLQNRGNSEVKRNNTMLQDGYSFASERRDNNSKSRQIIERHGGQNDYHVRENESKLPDHSLSPLFSISEDGDSEMEMSYKSPSDHPLSIEQGDSELRDNESSDAQDQHTETEERSRSTETEERSRSTETEERSRSTETEERSRSMETEEMSRSTETEERLPRSMETEERSRSDNVFSKGLDISEHTTAIEMSFDNNKFERRPDTDNASAVKNNLQLFRDEYKRHVDGIDSGDRNSKNPGKSRNFPENNRISHAPQPHDDETGEDENIRDPFMSKADTRDDNAVIGSSRYQGLSTSESIDSSTGNSNELSDMRRILQQQMTGLRGMSAATATAAGASGRKPEKDFSAMAMKVTAQFQEMHREYGTMGAPRGPVKLDLPMHRPQSKFFPQKTSQMQRRGPGSSPFDESLNGRDTLPFDEHSWVE